MEIYLINLSVPRQTRQKLILKYQQIMLSSNTKIEYIIKNMLFFLHDLKTPANLVKHQPINHLKTACLYIQDKLKKKILNNINKYHYE